jgi:hypothetical protein
MYYVYAGNGTFVQSQTGKVPRSAPVVYYKSQRTAIATSAHQQKVNYLRYGNLIKKSRLLMLENHYSLAIFGLGFCFLLDFVSL